MGASDAAFQAFVRNLAISLKEEDKPRAIESLWQFVQQVGISRAEELLAIAIDLHGQGIVKTKQGEPRTLGGVFFHLARQDSDATRQQQDAELCLKISQIDELVAQLQQSIDDVVYYGKANLRAREMSNRIVRRTLQAISLLLKRNKTFISSDLRREGIASSSKVVKKRKPPFDSSSSFPNGKRRHLSKKRRTNLSTKSRSKAQQQRVDNRRNKKPGSGIVLRASGQTRVAGSHRS